MTPPPLRAIFKHMDHIPAEKLINNLSCYFQSRRDVAFAFLFGSCAAGANGPMSDVDLGYDSNYPTGEETAYQGAASGAFRVLRGGGWRYNASNCTVANRSRHYPYRQDYRYGFRVVRP